jgi:hypothetical protein
MPQAPRVSPADARSRNQAGNALLVCAYDDPAKCESLRLEGALTFQEFQKRLPALSKDQEIVFYCA